MSLADQSTDVAIIGGGLAGAIAAIHLAQRGIRTTLLEKDPAPRPKVCGEFLSGEGLAFLREVGIDLGHAGVDLREFVLHAMRKELELALPIPAFGIPRQELDAALLAHAAHRGTDVRRGVLVRDCAQVGQDDGDARFRLATSEGTLHARRVVLASGKHEFRPLQRRTGSGKVRIGLKTHLRLSDQALARLGERIHLFVFQGGYGGLSQVGEGIANFALVIERDALKKVGSDFEGITRTLMRDCPRSEVFLNNALPLSPRMFTTSIVPYGFVRREPSLAGVYCVGDQFVVIPSLTGDGMTLALATGRAAALSIADERHLGVLQPASSAIAFDQEMRHLVRAQIRTAVMLDRLFGKPRVLERTIWLGRRFTGITRRLFLSTRLRS